MKKVRWFVAMSIPVSILPCLALFMSSVLADGGVTFKNIAQDPTVGISYQRTPAATFPSIVAFRQDSLVNSVDPMDLDLLSGLPYQPAGQAGVAILDYDRDGDLDIYVTNGPGTPNSLFSNQLEETGSLAFVDVAVAVGVDATSQDSMGVCYGDIDNNGYEDIYVLGRSEPNRLFRNDGGAFTELDSSGTGGGNLPAASAAMGDVNGDGLLDIVVANAYHHDDGVGFRGCFVDIFGAGNHNQLFLNQGDCSFVDVSAASGIEDLAGFPPGFEGSPGVTWAAGMVDIDQDGDVDILFADDQCAFPDADVGGLDAGFLHVLHNDGTGYFADHPILIDNFSAGSWMGLSFGDLNSDGEMDVFSTNVGDYIPGLSPAFGSYVLGDRTSRWFLGNGVNVDGVYTFSDPAAGRIVSAFGWGSAIFDYDNDGDQDILYHGGNDGGYGTSLTAENPGTLLRNQDGTAEFTLDIQAIDQSALTNPHHFRAVHGLSTGDLNRDGFMDIVTVSSFEYENGTGVPLLSPLQYGSPLDATAFAIVFLFSFDSMGFLRWNGNEFAPGSLALELNSGNNGNRWIKVRTVGSVGIVDGGQVNRDGVGAVVSFTPRNGKTVLKPVASGGSFSSQHSLELVFGLGKKSRGTVEVLWPGGVRNRLNKVKKFEEVVFPEIPCSFDGDWDDKGDFEECLENALEELVDAGIIDEDAAEDFEDSMIDAFREFHDDDDEH